MNYDPIKYEVMWTMMKQSLKNMQATADTDFKNTALTLFIDLMDDTERTYTKTEEENK